MQKSISVKTNSKVSHNPKLTCGKWQHFNEVTGSTTNSKNKVETIISNDKVCDAYIKPNVVSDIFNHFLLTKEIN